MRHCLLVSLCIVTFSVNAAEPAAPSKSNVTLNPNGSVTLKDDALSLKLVLPKGSQADAAAASEQGLAYVFRLNTLTIALQKMGKPIPVEFSDKDAASVKKSLPATHQLVPGEWGGHRLMVLRALQMAAKQEMVDFGAQVPLPRMGVILHVAGPVADEELAKKTLDDLLTKLVAQK